jgi:hypothetical protein
MHCRDAPTPTTSADEERPFHHTKSYVTHPTVTALGSPSVGFDPVFETIAYIFVPLTAITVLLLASAQQIGGVRCLQRMWFAGKTAYVLTVGALLIVGQPYLTFPIVASFAIAWYAARTFGLYPESRPTDLNEIGWSIVIILLVTVCFFPAFWVFLFIFRI